MEAILYLQSKMELDKVQQTEDVIMEVIEQWGQESYLIPDLMLLDSQVMDKANMQLAKIKWEILKSKFHLLLMIKRRINMNVLVLVEIETLKVLKKQLHSIKDFNPNSSKWLSSKCHQAEIKLQRHYLQKMIWELNICRI